MTFFVGIDPSITNTGVVVVGETGTAIDHYNSSSVGKKPKDMPAISWYGWLADGVVSFLEPYTHDRLFLVYEDYSYGSVHRAFSLAEFGGILKYRVMPVLTDIPRLVAPTKVKRFATGNGGATKEQMASYACRESAYLAELPPNECTDDVCDAWFMAKMALYFYNRQTAINTELNRDLLRIRLEITK